MNLHLVAGMDDRVRVVIYGEFQAGRLGASYEWAFRDLGHDVVRFEIDDAAAYLAVWLRNRVSLHVSKFALQPRRTGSIRWNQHFVGACSRASPDLVFVLNGHFIMPETVRRIRENIAPIVIFHADNPFPPHSSSRPENLLAARESNCYFIWSRNLRARLLTAHVPRVEYLPFAWDPGVFPFMGVPNEPQRDIVFVGGWDRSRERFLTPIAQHFDLKIWGPAYWRTRTRADSDVRRCWQGSAIYGGPAADILNTSKIVLNPLREQNLPDGTNMRTFEAPGSGAFVLSTRTSGAQELFHEGVAGAYFGDGAECLTQIERYLKDASARMAIRQQAHEIVEKEHTYIHRSSDLLSALTAPFGSH